MINNFEQIKKLLKFPPENIDIFYIVEIIQRKKDDGSLERNMNLIKSWDIPATISLIHLQPHIIKMCEHFNARAYIRLNMRSYRKVALEALKIMASHIADGNYHACKKAFFSAAGQFHSDPEKKWLIDIDEEPGNFAKRREKVWPEVCDTIIEICNNDPNYHYGPNYPNGNPIIITIPTKNGYHLITHPFNQQKFKEKYPEIEIHKDNPTVLYIP